MTSQECLKERARLELNARRRLQTLLFEPHYYWDMETDEIDVSDDWFPDVVKNIVLNPDEGAPCRRVVITPTPDIESAVGKALKRIRRHLIFGPEIAWIQTRMVSDLHYAIMPPRMDLCDTDPDESLEIQKRKINKWCDLFFPKSERRHQASLARRRLRRRLRTTSARQAYKFASEVSQMIFLASAGPTKQTRKRFDEWFRNGLPSLMDRSGRLDAELFGNVIYQVFEVIVGVLKSSMPFGPAAANKVDAVRKWVYCLRDFIPPRAIPYGYGVVRHVPPDKKNDTTYLREALRVAVRNSSADLAFEALYWLFHNEDMPGSWSESLMPHLARMFMMWSTYDDLISVSYSFLDSSRSDADARKKYVLSEWGRVIYRAWNEQTEGNWDEEDEEILFPSMGAKCPARGNMAYTSNMMVCDEKGCLTQARFWDGVRWMRRDPETLALIPEEEVMEACTLVQQGGIEQVSSALVSSKCLPPVRVPVFPPGPPKFDSEPFEWTSGKAIAAGALGAAVVGAFLARRNK